MAPFSSRPLKVIAIKSSIITVESLEGATITRDASRFKRRTFGGVAVEPDETDLSEPIRNTTPQLDQDSYPRSTSPRSDAVLEPRTCQTDIDTRTTTST